MQRPCVRVPKEEGESVRKELDEQGLRDYDFEISVKNDHILIPIIELDSVVTEYEVVYVDVDARDHQTMPRDFLEFEPSYERLGDIVILHEDDRERAERIADAILASDLKAKTVVNRASPIKGKRRVRDWEVIAGDGTETIHREYGCEFTLDIAEVYFSPRLATERHRVVDQYVAGERVFDMFAGVGPFVIPFANRGADTIGVDINEVAIAYLRQNANRNGVTSRVTAILDDVRNTVSTYEGWADRIIMNLPHSADAFLETAIALAGSECVIHYYDIQSDTDPFTPAEAEIKSVATPDYEVTIENRRVVRSYAPHEFNICIDAKIRQHD